MEVAGVEFVLEYLKQNGFLEAELALKEDMIEKKKTELRSFDFETFLFPMVPPPRPVRISNSFRRSDGGDCAVVATEEEEEAEEFVSLQSSSSITCSSEFINPYGVTSGSATGAESEASSDRLSAFGTARDYHDSDVQDEAYWYEDKDGGCFMTPCFNALEEPFGCASEDKFVMTSEENAKQCENPFALGRKSEHWPSTFEANSMDDVNKVQLEDYYHFDDIKKLEKGVKGESDDCDAYNYSSLCKCCAGAGGVYNQDPVNYGHLSSKECRTNDIQFNVDYEQKMNIKNSLINTLVGELKSVSDSPPITASGKDFEPNRKDSPEVGGITKVVGETLQPRAVADEKDAASFDELMMFDNHDEENEVFNLRIIHRKNRTGFEENKDFPIVLNTIIAGRYYVTEYLGSAAFSKVIQAQDLLTGIDVCLKIIKNDKDFFDQSLDEIKLLKLVNKQDPADEHHILRLYDYFYHQEHLFIVCELLRANLYEFQKYNQESGGEPYFTLRRLQVITRQCLEALEFLHQMGIIHCDLKPENILIKSYRRCEIKIIDLGSSCFLTDNLSLYVQSRSYRAPEVILGLPYDQKIDIWSLGCILAELCSGEVLFPNDSLAMLLARVIGKLGPIDMEMLMQGQETNKYFTQEYDLYYVNEGTDELEYIIPEESSLEDHLQVSDVGFIDFVTWLLEINPSRRPTAKEALQHPWLSHQYDL